MLGLVPVDTADNILHLLISLTGIAAGLSSPATVQPRSARTGAA